MLSISPSRAIRPTAWTSTTSSQVGPGRERPCRKIGEAMWTKGSGTNSVKPPVRRWIWRSTSRWLAQERGPSMWPIIIVVVARRPSSWAVIITSAHSAVRTLSGHRWARTRSSRISAAVPGRVPRPASRRRARNSRTLIPSVWAPCQTSSGVKPCTCISGRRSLIPSSTET